MKVFAGAVHKFFMLVCAAYLKLSYIILPWTSELSTVDEMLEMRKGATNLSYGEEMFLALA